MGVRDGAWKGDAKIAGGVDLDNNTHPLNCTTDGTLEVNLTGAPALPFKFDINGNLLVDSVGLRNLKWDTDVDFAKGTGTNYVIVGTGPSALLETAKTTSADGIFYNNPTDFAPSSSDIEVSTVASLAHTGFPVVPYAWWHFDESSGATVVDSSGNGRNGTIGGTGMTRVPALISNGLFQTRIDTGYVNFGNIAAFERTDSFSIECWANCINNAGTDPLFTKCGPGPMIRGYRVAIQNNTVIYQLISDDSAGSYAVVRGNIYIPAGSWHQIVVTYDGSSTAAGMQIYVDGVLDTPTVLADVLTSSIVSTANFIAGAWPTDAAYPGATLDEYVIYNGVLSPSEVLFRYNGGAGTESPISSVAYSTADNLYIDTTALSQIAPASLVSFLSLAAVSSRPTGTSIRVLFSVDGRTTWLTWNGTSWAAPVDPTLRSTATILSVATTNFASLPIGSGTLDARLFLYTSDSALTPTVSYFTVSFSQGYYTSAHYETNIFDSGVINQPWGYFDSSILLPSGTSVVVRARASNVLTSMGAYGSPLTAGMSTGISGQFVQFSIDFAGTIAVTAAVDYISVLYNYLNYATVTP